MIDCSQLVAQVNTSLLDLAEMETKRLRVETILSAAFQKALYPTVAEQRRQEKRTAMEAKLARAEQKLNTTSTPKRESPQVATENLMKALTSDTAHAHLNENFDAVEARLKVRSRFDQVEVHLQR